VRASFRSKPHIAHLKYSIFGNAVRAVVLVAARRERHADDVVRVRVHRHTLPLLHLHVPDDDPIVLEDLLRAVTRERRWKLLGRRRSSEHGQQRRDNQHREHRPPSGHDALLTKGG
jgi:hypothetical protein